MLTGDLVTTLMEKTNYMRSKIRGCSNFSFSVDIEKDIITLRCNYYTGEYMQKDVRLVDFYAYNNESLSKLVSEYF